MPAHMKPNRKLSNPLINYIPPISSNTSFQPFGWVHYPNIFLSTNCTLLPIISCQLLSYWLWWLQIFIGFPSKCWWYKIVLYTLSKKYSTPASIKTRHSFNMLLRQHEPKFHSNVTTPINLTIFVATSCNPSLVIVDNNLLTQINLMSSCFSHNGLFWLIKNTWGVFWIQIFLRITSHKVINALNNKIIGSLYQIYQFLSKICFLSLFLPSNIPIMR